MALIKQAFTVVFIFSFSSFFASASSDHASGGVLTNFQGGQIGHDNDRTRLLYGYIDGNSDDYDEGRPEDKKEGELEPDPAVPVYGRYNEEEEESPKLGPDQRKIECQHPKFPLRIMPNYKIKKMADWKDGESEERPSIGISKRYNPLFMKRYNPLFRKNQLGKMDFQFGTSEDDNESGREEIEEATGGGVKTVTKYIVEVLPNTDICFAGRKLPFQMPKIRQVKRAFMFLLLKLFNKKCPVHKGCIIQDIREAVL